MLGDGGDVDAGADLLQDVLRERRGESAAYLVLASFYSRYERFDDALELLEAADRRFPDDTAILFQLGAVLERSDRPRAAELAFRRVLAQDPEHSATLNYLGYMLADRGERLEGVGRSAGARDRDRPPQRRVPRQPRLGVLQARPPRPRRDPAAAGARADGVELGDPGPLRRPDAQARPAMRTPSRPGSARWPGTATTSSPPSSNGRLATPDGGSSADDLQPGGRSARVRPGPAAACLLALVLGACAPPPIVLPPGGGSAPARLRGVVRRGRGALPARRHLRVPARP